jgi:exonuclease VII large subunit
MANESNDLRSAMTPTQAANFVVPYANKRLVDMRAEDWAVLRNRLHIEQTLLDAVWLMRRWSAERDQMADALADRLADLIDAIQTIMGD